MTSLSPRQPEPSWTLVKILGALAALLALVLR